MDVMQPTPPAWVSWYRRVRMRARDPLRAHNRIAVYTFARDRDDPTTHLIRLNSMLGPKRGDVTPPGEPWRRERYSVDAGWPARLPVPAVPADFKPYNSQQYHYEPISIVLPAAPPSPAGGGVVGGSVAGVGGWGGAARGWAAGTALLALLVLLVRTAEKCLDKKLFHIRRRQSEEWPTPNVLATSHRNLTTDQQGDPESFPSDITIDLPPPYSECAASSVGSSTGQIAGPNVDANKPPNMEEPPPPYSACYVTYTNPKDGIPSVHIYNRRRPAEAGSSQNEEDNRSGIELMFDNGRVVEREGRKETSDLSNNVTDNSHSGGDNTRDSVILV